MIECGRRWVKLGRACACMVGSYHRCILPLDHPETSCRCARGTTTPRNQTRQPTIKGLTEEEAVAELLGELDRGL